MVVVVVVAVQYDDTYKLHIVGRVLNAMLLITLKWPSC
jgi:hypothetical protein